MVPGGPTSAAAPARVVHETKPSLADVARNAATDLVDLVVAQIKLARLELATDARQALQRTTKLVAFGIPLLFGYGFAMAAAASALSSFCGWSLSLLAVATIQMVVGMVGICASLRGSRPVRILDRSTAQAESTVRGALTAVAKGHGATSMTGPP
jgi:uncharacterized membrane protein YqjE